MPGATAPNLKEGARSEILADYLFSGWGTVTPVRWQDDHGIDLHCTLTERVGRNRAFVCEYFSVQVKSTSNPWVLRSRDEIKWLIEHPTPLYLAVVDKAACMLSIYKTSARFLVAFWDLPASLTLKPSAGDQGRCPQYQNPSEFELSAPILRVTLQDLTNKEKLEELRKVFKYWVAVDRENCTFRRMGLLRLREPHAYRTNEVPNAGITEQGMVKPTPAQMRAAVRTLVEAVDCVGHQMFADGDREAGVLAALLLRHLRTARRAQFVGDLRWNPESASGFETTLMFALNEELMPGEQPQYVGESFDKVAKQIALTELFARFTRRRRAGRRPLTKRRP